MAADPYETLGVAKTASDAEIQRAYRKLAKQHHPDLNPGNKAAEERFKTIASANDLLSDPDKRARFDRGEIDAAGDARPPPGYYNAHAQGPGGRKYRPENFADGGYEDIFAEFLNQAGRANPRGPKRGQDRTFSLEIDFLDAVRGATQTLTLPGGATLDVRIPAGIEDGQTLRLKGKGDPGGNNGAAGDGLIEIAVRPHPWFVRDGADILLDLPVSLQEAVLGGKVAVPTATGPVSLSIPPHSANGARLRLRGRGIAARGGQPAGDQYVTLRLVLDPQDEALAEWLRDHPARPGFDPRPNLTVTP